jgi:peroxiredoxin
MEGKPVPGFLLQDGSGKEFSHKDFSGSWLALFFYSKDNTSG